MTTSHKFEDLNVWRESRELIRAIRKICRNPTASKDFSFVDQITRAARSISANIAEGAESESNKEFIQFLNYAKRSAGEVRSHLYDAFDESYIDEKIFLQLKLRAEKIGRMLGAFMIYLRNPVTRNPQLETEI